MQSTTAKVEVDLGASRQWKKFSINWARLATSFAVRIGPGAGRRCLGGIRLEDKKDWRISSDSTKSGGRRSVFRDAYVFASPNLV